MNTTLKFDGGVEADLEFSSLAFAVILPVGERTLLRAGGGPVLDGSLQVDGAPEQTFDSAGLVFAGFEKRTGAADGWTPSLDLSLTLGFSWGKTTGPEQESADYRATDLRAGVRTGWVVGNWLFPYAAGRVFGGPVNWEFEGNDVSGTDAHHFQLAAGAGVSLGPLVVFFEVAGAGERGANVGLASNW
jgi:hypothetical protein